METQLKLTWEKREIGWFRKVSQPHHYWLFGPNDSLLWRKRRQAVTCILGCLGSSLILTQWMPVGPRTTTQNCLQTLLSDLCGTKLSPSWEPLGQISENSGIKSFRQDHIHIHMKVQADSLPAEQFQGLWGMRQVPLLAFLHCKFQVELSLWRDHSRTIPGARGPVSPTQTIKDKWNLVLGQRGI